MDKDRLDVIVCRTHGYISRLDDIWRGIRRGQFHDPMIREAIIEDYRVIANGLMAIHKELKQDALPEEMDADRK